MARDRTPRDAFGRPLDPDADFGVGAAAAGAGGSTNAALGTDAPRTDAAPTASRPAPPVEDARRVRHRGDSPGPPAGREATNPQAPLALVLGALGIVVLPYVFSIAAIVVANRADRVADALPGAPGRSAARIGRILGYVGLGLWLVLPVVVVFALLVAASGSG